MKLDKAKTMLKSIEADLKEVRAKRESLSLKECMLEQMHSELIYDLLEARSYAIVDHADGEGWGYTVEHKGKNIDNDEHNRIRDYNDAAMVAMQHAGIWHELQAA